MTIATTCTAADAIEMMRRGGVDLASELHNVSASYADITDEIERDGGEYEFTMAEFEAALRAAVAGEQRS
jgi:hypothetical protein